MECIYVLVLVLHLSFREEQYCSRFHYEEQLLQKMVRVEVQLGNIETRLRALENKGKSTCPDSWIPFKSSCYMFDQRRMNFFAADVACLQFHSHLVYIEDKEENEFIKTNLKRLPASDWWIALTDLDVEGTWKWFHSGITAEFKDFIEGQPDNHLGAEQCVDLRSAIGFMWNDEDCPSPLNFICEKEMDVQEY